MRIQKSILLMGVLACSLFGFSSQKTSADAGLTLGIIGTALGGTALASQLLGGNGLFGGRQNHVYHPVSFAGCCGAPVAPCCEPEPPCCEQQVSQPYPQIQIQPQPVVMPMAYPVYMVPAAMPVAAAPAPAPAPVRGLW